MQRHPPPIARLFERTTDAGAAPSHRQASCAMRALLRRVPSRVSDRAALGSVSARARKTERRAIGAHLAECEGTDAANISAPRRFATCWRLAHADLGASMCSVHLSWQSFDSCGSAPASFARHRARHSDSALHRDARVARRRVNPPNRLADRCAGALALSCACAQRSQTVMCLVNS